MARHVTRVTGWGDRWQWRCTAFGCHAHSEGFRTRAAAQRSADEHEASAQ